jgi:hypothetical protein
MVEIVGLIVFLIVAAAVLWLLSYALERLPIPIWLKNVILALVAILFLLYLLQRYGLI